MTLDTSSIDNTLNSLEKFHTLFLEQLRETTAKLSKTVTQEDFLPVPVPPEKEDKATADFNIPTMSKSQLDCLINAAIFTVEGASALSSVMVNPILQNVRYQCLTRRLLVENVLEKGQNSYVYLESSEVIATSKSDKEKPVESKMCGDEIEIKPKEITANPTVDISSLNSYGFNLVDAVVQAVSAALTKKEEQRLFKAIDKIVGENPQHICVRSGDMLLKRDFINLKKQIEVDKKSKVTAFVMHPTLFSDLEYWQHNSGMDFVSLKSARDTGLWGILDGVNIYVSDNVEQDNIYAFADPEMVGLLVVKEDIQTMCADRIELGKYGWLARENVEVHIYNKNKRLGVAVGKKYNPEPETKTTV